MRATAPSARGDRAYVRVINRTVILLDARPADQLPGGTPGVETNLPQHAELFLYGAALQAETYVKVM